MIRRTFVNLFSLAGAKALSILVPIFVLPYLSIKLGLEGFGYISYGFAFGVLFETYLRYGFDLLAVREGSCYSTNNNNFSQLVSRVIIARLVLLFCGLLITFISVVLLGIQAVYVWLIALNMIMAAFNVFINDWVYQAIEKMYYIAIYTVASRIIYVALILLLIDSEKDYIFEPIAMVAGSFLIMVVSNWILFCRLGIRFVLVDKSCIVEDLRSGFGLFLTFLAPNLYTSLTAIYLKAHGLREVGVFYGGYRFISVFEALNHVVNRVFYPIFAKNRKGFSKFIRIGMVLAVIASIGLYLCAPFLVRYLLAEEFINSVKIIRIMSLAPILLFTMLSFGHNRMVLIGKTVLYSKIVIGVSLLGGIVSYIMIASYGATGGAFAIIGVWTLRSILTYFYSFEHNVT